jgi:hypothetical protein
MPLPSSRTTSRTRGPRPPRPSTFHSLDPQDPTLRHRVPRVERKIEQDLLELPAVRTYVPQVVGEPQLQVDRVADGAVQHARQAVHHLVEAQRRGLHHLAAPEREQLPRQRGGPLGRALDLGHVLLHPRVGGAVLDEAGVAQDRRQQVVEVMGDAARQLADALQALGVMQFVLEPVPLPFGPDPLRDVLGHSGHPGRAAVVVGQHVPAAEEIALLAVGADDAALELV